MVVMITHPTTNRTAYGELTLGYRAARTDRSVRHRVLGLATPVVTYRPPSMRTGTIRVLATDEAAADELIFLLTGAGPFTYVDADALYMTMNFIVAGDIADELDAETRVRHIIEIPYEEVSP